MSFLRPGVIKQHKSPVLNCISIIIALMFITGMTPKKCLSLSHQMKPKQAVRSDHEVLTSLLLSGTFRFLPVNNLNATTESVRLTYHIGRIIVYVVILSALTLTLPGPSAGVSGSLDSYCSLKPLCSGMGEVVPARTSPTRASPIPSHCAVIILFQSVPVHQLP